MDRAEKTAMPVQETGGPQHQAQLRPELHGLTPEERQAVEALLAELDVSDSQSII